MKIETYSHPNFKHRYMITEEVLHFDAQKRWVFQQIDEKGAILPREIPLNLEEYNKMIAQLNEQGWKTLLEE